MKYGLGEVPWGSRHGLGGVVGKMDGKKGAKEKVHAIGSLKGQ